MITTGFFNVVSHFSVAFLLQAIPILLLLQITSHCTFDYTFSNTNRIVSKCMLTNVRETHHTIQRKCSMSQK